MGRSRSYVSQSTVQKAITTTSRIINDVNMHIDNFQPRQDIVGLTVLYKAQYINAPYLEPLKQLPRRNDRFTRAA